MIANPQILDRAHYCQIFADARTEHELKLVLVSNKKLLRTMPFVIVNSGSHFMEWANSDTEVILKQKHMV